MWKEVVILGVDLDGVCADIVAGYRPYVASIKGVDAATLGVVADYNFSSWGLDRPLTEQPEFFEALQRGMAAEMPVITGVSQGLQELAVAGIKIRIISGRLVRSGMYGVVADTIKWMQANGLVFDELCFVKQKEEVAADLYVEDDPRIGRQLVQAGKSVVIFDQPYNRQRELRIERTRSWVELTQTILETHRQQHDSAE